MVFLTALMFFPKNYKPQSSRFFKRLQFKRLAAKYMGRSRNCYGVGLRIVHRAMRYSTVAEENKPYMEGRLHETRLEASCLEHDMDKKYLLTSLAEHDINLNRETLSNLAIYEPRTFQSVCEFVKVRATETGLQSGVIGSPEGAAIRGIQGKVKKASS